MTSLRFLCWLAACVLYVDLIAHGFSTKLQRIQRAMELTNSMQQNITAAYNALDLWDEALSSSKKLPSSILVTSLQLQASCLVRTGQDARAVDVLDRALLSTTDEDPAGKRMRRQKGQSLQRLLCYHQAMKEYVQAGAVVEAATCHLRLGDSKSAMAVLQNASYSFLDCDGQIMLEMLRFLMDPSNFSKERLQQIFQDARDSPVNRWFYSFAMGNANKTWASKPPSLEYYRANIGPWDDPLLVHLDDKILLHQLLTTSTSTSNNSQSFWPRGVVLSKQSFQELLTNSSNYNARMGDCDEGLWIGKQRAGYGSHGNVLIQVSMKQVEDVVKKKDNDSHRNDAVLLQQIVEPPLLVQGRKFSLRVYVAYFLADGSRPQEIYISSDGLVKIASLPVSAGDTSNPRQHMTNSGREVAMQQESFDFLRSELPSGHFDDRLWPRIQRTVDCVMNMYQKHALHQEQNTSDKRSLVRQSDLTAYRDQLGKLGLPKILGFDFVADTSFNTWLVEVNRFPGLEPRDVEMDAAVKHRVILDAWEVAASR